MPMFGDNELLHFVGSFSFHITIPGLADKDDVSANSFTTCSGIKSQTEVIEFKHGMDTIVRKGAGRTTYEPITLERVYRQLDTFESWREQIVNGELARLDVDLEYRRHSEEHPDGSHAVRKFTLHNAWPSRWESPDLNAMASDAAIERIELTFEDVNIMSDDNVGGGYLYTGSAVTT